MTYIETNTYVAIFSFISAIFFGLRYCIHHRGPPLKKSGFSRLAHEHQTVYRKIFAPDLGYWREKDGSSSVLDENKVGPYLRGIRIHYLKWQRKPGAKEKVFQAITAVIACLQVNVSNEPILKKELKEILSWAVLMYEKYNDEIFLNWDEVIYTNFPQCQKYLETPKSNYLPKWAFPASIELPSKKFLSSFIFIHLIELGSLSFSKTNQKIIIKKGFSVPFWKFIRGILDSLPSNQIFVTIFSDYNGIVLTTKEAVKKSKGAVEIEEHESTKLANMHRKWKILAKVRNFSE